MHTAAYLWQAAQAKKRRALPVLSFPAIQLLGVTVRELIADSTLQAKAMQTIARETPSLASVSLMDLSVEAEAFGACVRMTDNEIPTITGQMITSDADADALRVPSVGAGRTGVCMEALRLAKQCIDDRPVLAGVIGPYSLAGRLCDVTEAMYLCYDEPELMHAVLRKATDFLIAYCRAFQQTGADGVVMAEPLAGLLSPDLCAAFSNPYVQEIIDAVQTDTFAVIYHNCGSATIQMLPALASLGAAAYHFGNAVDMRKVLDKAPKTMLCLGNIDPAGQLMHGTPESVTQATRALLHTCGGEPNFIPSSGCDIPPQAKWANIRAFFQAVAEA